MKYDDRMDPECIAICDAINLIPGIRTVDSCCGHGKFPFSVYMYADDARYTAIILFYVMEHRWNMRLRTDCTMYPPYIVLDSEEVGEKAYEQASDIAEDITAFMNDFEGDDEPGDGGFTQWKQQHIGEEEDEQNHS